MIEYRAPSGGGNLPYPLHQVRLDLSNNDFTKLNSAPIQLIAAASSGYICPLQFVIDYDANLLPNSTIYIGFEALLGYDIGTAYSTIQTFPMSGNQGVFNLSTRYYNNNYADTNNASLVLWQLTDTALGFSRFIMYITYIIVPL